MWLSRPFFFVAVSIIVLVSATGAFYLEYELRKWLDERIETEALDQAQAYRARIEVERSTTSIETFDAIIDSLIQTDDRRVTLIRSDGSVLGDSYLDLDRIREVENHGDRPEVVGATQSRPGINRRRSKTLGVDTLHVAVPFETPAVQGVIMHTPWLLWTAVSRMRLLLVFACLLGLVIAILVSWVASYLSARRLRNLIDRAGLWLKVMNTGTHRAASTSESPVQNKSSTGSMMLWKKSSKPLRMNETDSVRCSKG